MIKTKNKRESIAKLLKTAGDSARLKILCAVFDDKERCVSEIAEKLGLSVAIVSHHLQVMARTGFLKPVRKGKRIHYILSKEPFVVDLKGLICKYK